MGRGGDCNVLLFLCGDMLTINLKQKKPQKNKKKSRKKGEDEKQRGKKKTGGFKNEVCR